MATNVHLLILCADALLCLSCAVVAIVLAVVDAVPRYPVGVVHVRWLPENNVVTERAQLTHLYTTLCASCVLLLAAVAWDYERWRTSKTAGQNATLLHLQSSSHQEAHHGAAFYGGIEDIEGRRQIEVAALAWMGMTMHTFAGGLDVTTNFCQAFVLGSFGAHYHESWLCRTGRSPRAAGGAWVLSLFCCILTAAYAARADNEVPETVLLNNVVVVMAWHLALLVALAFRYRSNRQTSQKGLTRAELRAHYSCLVLARVFFAVGLMIFCANANPRRSTW